MPLSIILFINCKKAKSFYGSVSVQMNNKAGTLLKRIADG